MTVNGVDTLSVPASNWTDYNVIAPNISVPSEQVTYTFLIKGGDGLSDETVDFTVLVLNSSFVQIFDLLIPILAIIAVSYKPAEVAWALFIGVHILLSILAFDLYRIGKSEKEAKARAILFGLTVWLSTIVVMNFILLKSNGLF